jgi:uncharacterized membrane protein YhdT
LPLRLQATPRVGGGSAFYVRPIHTMKKAANITQLVLTILAVFSIVVMVRVAGHNHHPTTFQIVIEITSSVIFYLWLLFSVVHLLVKIILKAVSLDKTGIEKKS